MYGKASLHPSVKKFLLLLDTDAQLWQLGLVAIAKQVGVSRSHLQHLVRGEVGATCTQLIRAKHVERMRAHLHAHPEQSLAEVAYQSGCEPQTMYRQFQAVLGMNPSTLRKM